MKKICRIRLINWHYFVDETIKVNGSFLLSGENKAGKSTVIDAIQFVLTTDHRKFNRAANEKSKRDLRGYVRCKTGVEGKGYLRKGAIIAYTAIEFFDENTNSYFVVGAKIDSPDEETTPTVQWFIVNSKLDNIIFITGNKPSMDDQFKCGDKKIAIIAQQREARSQIQRRLGNLDEKFFALLPQSVAFKPMDDVKQFINKFILPEKEVDISLLQKSIAHLDELKNLMEQVEKQISQLNTILEKKYEIDNVRHELRINEIMMKMAEIEEVEILIETINKNMNISIQKLTITQDNIKNITEDLIGADEERVSLRLALQNNDTAGLVRDFEQKEKELTKDYNAKKVEYERLKVNVEQTKKAMYKLNTVGVTDFSEISANLFLADSNVSIEDKLQMSSKIKETTGKLYEQYKNMEYKTGQEKKEKETEKGRLEKEIEDLNNKKLPYPRSTVLLKSTIEKEYTSRNIKSEVYVFCDLLEISDSKWQNAIESYLNMQRFYIIVEPKHYDIAVDVYNRNRNKISAVGLVNVGALPSNESKSTNGTLAEYVQSKNLYAKKYADYLLGRVVRCQDPKELKNHRIAITGECMLYQNYSVRKIPSETPFIGEYAFKRQIEICTEQLNKINYELTELREKEKHINIVLSALSEICYEKINDRVHIPTELKAINHNVKDIKEKLSDARKDPAYFELLMKLDETNKAIKNLNEKSNQSKEIEVNTKRDIHDYQNNKKFKESELQQKHTEIERLSENNQAEANDAADKYIRNRKERSPETIKANFKPRNTQLTNDESSIIQELIKIQMQFEGGNLGTGYDMIKGYVDLKNKLERSELVKYTDDLRIARNNCEIMFKESFLAQMSENIENAKQAFKLLNQSLDGIYYGEDTYYFQIDKNRRKEALYRMITSPNNIRHDAETFFSIEFESEFQDEISELFAKLTIRDDKDEKVVSEYADYRNYLDYDIRITNKNREVKWFSDVYGDMSGGEAQTPYYVAIAASFAQIYWSNDTIRVVMLDEAFDKMDDERIESMMNFFNKMNFQIIIGAPPAKIEVIGEFVDTVLMAYRDNQTSFIEEYDL